MISILFVQLTLLLQLFQEQCAIRTIITRVSGRKALILFPSIMGDAVILNETNKVNARQMQYLNRKNACPVMKDMMETLQGIHESIFSLTALCHTMNAVSTTSISVQSERHSYQSNEFTTQCIALYASLLVHFQLEKKDRAPSHIMHFIVIHTSNHSHRIVIRTLVTRLFVPTKKEQLHTLLSDGGNAIEIGMV